jgi:hypothetical protein
MFRIERVADASAFPTCVHIHRRLVCPWVYFRLKTNTYKYVVKKHKCKTVGIPLIVALSPLTIQSPQGMLFESGVWRSDKKDWIPYEDYKVLQDVCKGYIKKVRE